MAVSTLRAGCAQLALQAAVSGAKGMLVTPFYHACWSHFAREVERTPQNIARALTHDSMHAWAWLAHDSMHGLAWEPCAPCHHRRLPHTHPRKMHPTELQYTHMQLRTHTLKLARCRRGADTRAAKHTSIAATWVAVAQKPDTGLSSMGACLREGGCRGGEQFFAANLPSTSSVGSAHARSPCMPATAMSMSSCM
jgi:hypothetical protein